MRFRGILKRLHMRAANYITAPRSTGLAVTFPREVDVKYFKAVEGTFSIILVPFIIGGNIATTLGLVIFKNTPVQRFVCPSNTHIRLERGDSNEIVVYGYNGNTPLRSYKICEFTISNKRSKE